MRLPAVLLLSFLGASVALSYEPGSDQAPKERKAVRIVTLDPGHFHAALVHRESYAEVDDLVHVYAPLGLDLGDHLKRVARFNTRPAEPTQWRLEVHAGPDPLARMTREKAGNVVVISGRNRDKIDSVGASLDAGFNALVDKPWILRSEDLPKLEQALKTAREKGLVAYDMMTERFEVTTALQKELVNDTEVFGSVLPGSAAEPSVYMESVHHLSKTVAGAPLVRPAWFFDTEQQGEALSDVGTHLVDLVQWTLFPAQALDAARDTRLVAAQRWPTAISQSQFQRVTGEAEFPAPLRDRVKDGALQYFCNTLVTYTLKGVHVKLNVIWDWEAPAGGGDTHYAVYRGSRSRVEVRQGKQEGQRPQTYVVPNSEGDLAAVAGAVRKRLAAIQDRYPGVAAEERAGEILIKVPDRLRTSHEDHFGEVARAFFGYLKDPSGLPAWETANMLVKYTLTTRGTELSRQSPPRPAERLAPR